MADEYKYHLLYQLEPHPEGVSREEVPEGWGACDALAMVSLIYPPDGSLSSSTFGVTKDGAMGDAELFKGWLMLTAHLATNTTALSPGRKELVDAVWDLLKATIFTNAAEPPLDDAEAALAGGESGSGSEPK